MASYTKEELLSVAKGRQLIARAQPVQDDHQFISTVIDEEPADNDDMVMSEKWKARILKTQLDCLILMPLDLKLLNNVCRALKPIQLPS